MNLLTTALFLLFPLQRQLASFSQWLQTFGVGGLFALTLLDSAFVPTAGAPDALLLFLATHDQALLAAAAATLGSTIGCVVLYYISRTAGLAALSRFSAERRERVMGLLVKYDMLSVLVSAILPPPFPFKVFIIAAGALKFRLSRVVLAVLLGRAFRYGLLALVAYQYGAEAEQIFKQHYPKIALGLVVLIAVGLLGYLLVKRRRAAVNSTDLKKV